MKIAIIGTGGVGGYFGRRLANVEKDVTFVARGEHGKILKERGLTVKSVVGDFSIRPVSVVESINQLNHPDLVLFTVKTYDTEKAAKELAKVVHAETIVITFQNGVENDFVIKNSLIIGNVYPGVCMVISARTSPGVIEQTGGLRRLIFGDRNNLDNYKLKEVEGLMKNALIDAIVSDDITVDLWKKFIFITAFSGMTALMRKPIGDVLGQSESLKQYEEVVRESIAVAKALKVNLPEDIFEITMKTTRNTAPASKSSLLVDIENGRKNEIETLNGSLIKLAKNVKVNVPMNQKIYQAISAIH